MSESTECDILESIRGKRVLLPRCVLERVNSLGGDVNKTRDKDGYLDSTVEEECTK